jgi:hypothetical protein
MTAEEQACADAMDMRCLALCIRMLERVDGVRTKFPAVQPEHVG